MYCKQLDTCALYSWHKFKIYVEIVGILIVFILSGVVVFEFLLFTNLFLYGNIPASGLFFLFGRIDFFVVLCTKIGTK